MKISNSDLIRLTEIKQFFLEPPYTFKLFQQATPLYGEANSILEKYPFIPKHVLLNLSALYNQLTNNEKNINKIREILKESGRLLNSVNTK